MKYYIKKTLNTDFETAVSKTKEALQAVGFGILTEIDIHKKFKAKLDIDFKKYKILGACNPPLAHKALQMENKIGTMLPCNIIIQQLDENQIEVAAIDPVASLLAVDNEELSELAMTIKEKLQNAISMIS
jgi:uncharacterized protein (DUF302 family)